MPAPAAVVEEPAVLAVVGLAHRPVLALAQVVARRAHRVPLPLLAQAPVVAGLVVVRAVRLLNRQWSSAAMAGTTP